MHVPAEHDILALTKTTAAVACLETSCTMVGTVSRRRLLYFRDHLAVFFGTSLFEREAGLAAAVRMSVATTGSGLTLLLLPHCRCTEEQNEKEESKKTRDFVCHGLYRFLSYCCVGLTDECEFVTHWPASLCMNTSLACSTVTRRSWVAKHYNGTESHRAMRRLLRELVRIRIAHHIPLRLTPTSRGVVKEIFLKRIDQQTLCSFSSADYRPLFYDSFIWMSKGLV